MSCSNILQILQKKFSVQTVGTEAFENVAFLRIKNALLHIFNVGNILN